MFKQVHAKSREAILKELINARKELRENDENRVLNEKGFQTASENLFAPITKGVTENLEKGVSELKKDLKAIEDKSGVVIEEPSPLISLFENRAIESNYTTLDPVVARIMGEIENGMIERDKVKGIRLTSNGSMKLGPLDVTIERENNTIKVGGKDYPLSDGILRLLLTKEGGWDTYTPDEEIDYVDMLLHAGLLHKADGKKQGWKGKKYKEIVKPRIEEVIRSYEPMELLEILRKVGKTGSGICQKRSGKAIDVVVGSPDELLDQMQLSLASLQAGNTSNLLKNKVIAIADYLFKINKIKKVPI